MRKEKLFVNPDGGDVEANVARFNASSGDSSGCSEALKLPDGEDSYRDFEFTREERLLAKELQKASNYCSNFRVKIVDGKYNLYEDGRLLEQFESTSDLLEYCAMYSSLTNGRSPSNDSEPLFVENDADLLDVLRKLPRGTRFYPIRFRSFEALGDKYLGIISPEMDKVKKILKIYTLEQVYRNESARDIQKRRNAKLGNVPSSHASYRDALIASHAFRREIADYAVSNDDADYRACVLEQLNNFEQQTSDRGKVMKIRNFNGSVNRYYIDEVVSAPGGKSETERHSFATCDELKQYVKDANLTKDDIVTVGGCDLKDLLNEEYAHVEIPKKIKEFIDNLCAEINSSASESESSEDEADDPWYANNGYNENLWDRGTGGNYSMYGKSSSYYADEVMEAVMEEFGDIITTKEQELALYCYVEFMNEPTWTEELVEKVNNLHTNHVYADLEDLDDLKEAIESETIDLDYEDLEIEPVTRHGNPSGYYDVNFGNWLPDEDETATKRVDWTLEVDKDELYTFIYENEIGDCPFYKDEMFDPNDNSDWIKFVEWLDANYDTVYEKNKQKILDRFKEEAIREAEDYYDDYNWYNESLNHQDNQINGQSTDIENVDDDYSAEFVEGCTGVGRLKVLRGETDDRLVDYDDEF